MQKRGQVHLPVQLGRAVQFPLAFVIGLGAPRRVDRWIPGALSSDVHMSAGHLNQ